MRNEEKRGGKSRFLVVPVALLAIGGFWLSALAPSALAGKGAKTDLAIVSVKHKGYALMGEKLRVDVKIANRGRQAADGEISIDIQDANLPDLPGRDIPGLTIGKIKAGKVGTKEIVVGTAGTPIGRYSIEVCARSKGDKKKGNNCRKGKDFSQIPTAWSGTASATGTEPSGGATINVSTQPTASFYFDKLTPSGFRYTGEGTVKETISGGSLCTAKGSGTFGITSESTLLLSEDMYVYAAGGVSPPGATYPATQTCFGVESPPLAGPFQDWLQTGPRDKDPSATTLDGTYSETRGSLPLKWTWHFTAQP